MTDGEQSPADRIPGGARNALGGWFAASAGEPRYGRVLGLILLTLVAAALFGDSEAGTAVVVLFQTATLLLALRMSGARRLLTIVVGIALVIAIVGIVASSVAASDTFRAVVAVLTTMLVAATPAVILVRLKDFERVDRQVVTGALSVYLLIGFLFAQVYHTVGLVTGDPVFNQLADPREVDLLYFSFITMATVGYGDLTPATDTLRILAVLQALAGQLYLVTVVALVVSNLGKERRSRAATPAETGVDDGRTEPTGDA